MPLGNHPDLDEWIGVKMRLRRADIGMHRLTAGRRMGVSDVAYGKWENGQNSMSASRLWDAAQIMGLESPGYFFDGFDEIDPKSVASVHKSRKLITPANVRLLIRIGELGPRQRTKISQMVDTMLIEQTLAREAENV